MLDPILRPLKDSIFAPIAARMTAVAPNWVTAASTFLGIAAAGLLVDQQYAPAFLLWLTSRLLDGLDGAIARAAGRQSDLGGYLDILGDFIVYAAIPFALVIGRGSDAGALISLSLLLSAFYVNAASWMYLSALLEKRGAGARARGESTSVAMPDAAIGGTETLVAYSLLIIVPHYAVPIMLLFAALVAGSVIQRVIWAVRSLT